MKGEGKTRANLILLVSRSWGKSEQKLEVGCPQYRGWPHSDDKHTMAAFRRIQLAARGLYVQ